MRAATLAALCAGARALSGALPEGRLGLAAEGREAPDEGPGGAFPWEAEGPEGGDGAGGRGPGGARRRENPEASLDGGWPFLDSSSEVDAWVWMMNERNFNTPLYDPILLTVGEALHGVGANVAVVRYKNSEGMFRNVTAAIGRGRKPLIVAVAPFYATRNGGRRILRQCSDLGVFVALYQTEPLTERPEDLKGMVDLFNLTEMVDQVKPTEVWDYSRANLDWYPESARSMYRYMPPGYAQGLDLGIDTDRVSSLAHKEGMVGFLGSWKYRPPAARELYHKVLGDKLISRDSIWKKGDMIKFLSEYPVQLNTHKFENCCPSTNPLEAFRMAQILSNRACVVSARSDPRDEAEWAGIVHFAEPSQMPGLIDEIGRDVRGCQTQSFEIFRKRFDPAAILRRSGFLETWRPAAS